MDEVSVGNIYDGNLLHSSVNITDPGSDGKHHQIL